MLPLTRKELWFLPEAFEEALMERSADQPIRLLIEVRCRNL
jgi:hypothetical protein